MKYALCLLAVIIGLTVVSAASVQSQANPTTFFKESSGMFDVEGYIYTDGKNNSCQINTHYRDGSYISFVKDLVTREFWIEAHVKEPPPSLHDAGVKNIEGYWNFHNKNGSVALHQSIYFQKKDENTFQVRNMNVSSEEELKTFWNLFMSAHGFSFWYGEGPFHERIFAISLKGSRASVASMLRCMDAYDMIPEHMKVQPSVPQELIN
jgi:hypothetical protein